MEFAFIAIVFAVVGRTLGWKLSRGLLYTAPVALSVVAMVFWGGVVGLSMSGLICWLHPNIVVRWVFGFTLASYVAVPDLGLFECSTIADWDRARHVMISWVSLIAYVIALFSTKSMRA